MMPSANQTNNQVLSATNNQNQVLGIPSKPSNSRFSPETSKNVKLAVLGIIAFIAIAAVLGSIGVSIAHTQTNVPFASNFLNGMGNLSLIPQIAIPVVGSLIAGAALYGTKKVKQNFWIQSCALPNNQPITNMEDLTEEVL